MADGYLDTKRTLNESDSVRGGAYSTELLAGDADTALAQVGRAAVAGAGVGAYVSLLLAGARPELVPAALLLPGRGLAGGGAWPVFTETSRRIAPLFAEDARPPGGEDPRVRRLEYDIRPPDYAVTLARAARRLLLVEDGGARPPWWEAVRGCPMAEVVSAGEAFQRLATR